MNAILILALQAILILDAQRVKDAELILNSPALTQCTVYGKCKFAKSLANILSWEILKTSTDEDQESNFVSELGAKIASGEVNDDVSKKILAIETEKFAQLSQRVQSAKLQDGAFNDDASVTVDQLRAYQDYAKLKQDLDQSTLDQLNAL